MATQHYGWNLPTISGDLGAWGTKLNQAITDADVDLNAVETEAEAAQAAATAAQTTANSAYALAQTNATTLASKIVVYTRAPTASDTADDGVLWCQVSA
jgi:hypothetical protein